VILKALNYLDSSYFMNFLKDPCLALYSSSFTPLLSVLSYLIQRQTITSMLMLLNVCYHFELWVSLITSLTLKTITYPTACLPTEFIICGQPQQLSKNNNPTIHSTTNIILWPVGSVLYRDTSHLHNISLLFLNLAFTIFVT